MSLGLVLCDTFHVRREGGTEIMLLIVELLGHVLFAYGNVQSCLCVRYCLC